MNKSYLLVICLLSTSFVGCLDEESEDNEGPETAIYDMFESMGNNDWEAFCQSVGAEADWETREVVINQDAVDECINEDKGFFEIKFTIKEYTQELQSDTSAEEDVYYVTIVYDICSKVEEDFPEECEYDIKEDSLWMKVDGTWVDVSYLPWRNNSEATYSPTTVSLMYEKDSSNVYVVTVLAALTQEDLRDFSFFLKNETGSTYVGGNGFGEIAMQIINEEAHGIDMTYGGDDKVLENRANNVTNDDGRQFPVHFSDNDRDGKLSSGDQFLVYGPDAGPAQDGWKLDIQLDANGDIIGSAKLL